MKTIILSLILGAFLTINSFGQTIDTSFRVEGMCGMCKTRIERALDVKGVKVATWNVESKMLRLVYNSSKISEDEVHNLLTSEGHTTSKKVAGDEAYNKLHHCCKYPRE